MGILLCVCLSAFLILFAVNNPAQAVLSSPVAITMVIATLVADVYLLQSLLREWTRKHE
jgi:hypothetical protein